MTTLEDAQRDVALAKQELKRINGLIKPLERERDRVQKELMAAAEIVATHVDTDAELLAVSGTGTGHKRLNEIARGLHPAIAGFCRWAPPEARNVGPNTPIQTQVGLTLKLEHQPAEHYLDELTEALIEFNRRFVTNYTPPAGTTQYGGYADLHSHVDGRYCHIEFDPDGTRAELVLQHGAGFAITGTLREVLAKAAEYTWYDETATDEDEN